MQNSNYFNLKICYFTEAGSSRSICSPLTSWACVYDCKIKQLFYNDDNAKLK